MSEFIIYLRYVFASFFKFDRNAIVEDDVRTVIGVFILRNVRIQIIFRI